MSPMCFLTHIPQLIVLLLIQNNDFTKEEGAQCGMDEWRKDTGASSCLPRSSRWGDVTQPVVRGRQGFHRETT